ncbi:PKD domain-containing protein [Chryseobacterium sp. ERMR1:04]|uniref:PKD domain-containing protein n=1 Tax=Chryseobacterium sp. ERMR1:04 TaxID=1705393 RepID=UPI0006C8B536|nr:PKD domain-containing protein [Chryseobacterium sp. ERMR1:04]KPH15027.1 hypothetical protein AMQ68_06370 [Chryseobacterium sp. ERMR1:04]
MNTKLDNVTTQYRKFNENQALTEGQLNEFIDYFEDQDRLSRTRLSGVGVVCGFKSTYIDDILQPQASKEKIPGDIEIDFNTIWITQGAGVTTDGDLITLRQKGAQSSGVKIDFAADNYKYYRNYIDEVQYKHFRIRDQQIPLLELITPKEYEALGKNVGDFKPVREIDNIYGKTIILYLESYSNDETPCQDADCDNTGAEQVSNLKVLLADSESVSNLIARGDAKDSIFKAHDAYEELFDHLPNIEAKRVVLDADIKTAFDLKTKFQDAISAIAELSDGFNAIASTFNVGVNFGGQSLIQKLNSLFSFTGRGLDDYQYRYDLFKDLIDTYNEIKGLVLHLDVECCPSIASFPKHLMLGAVGARLELGDHNRFRHGFYNSPVTTNDDENYEKVVMLANRFVQKINGFQSYNGAIKITPSNLYVRLGKKAIPYYYKVDKPLLTQWNFEKTKTDREAYNLSYHTTNLAGDDFVQNPLDYNIDNNDFYRIEGHLGLPYKTALQNINDLKAKYGLAFDVIALVLQKDGKPTEPTKKETVSIEDLRKQLTSISSDISNKKEATQSTLLNISKLDEKLRLLNQAEFSKEGEGVNVVKQNPRKDDVVSELLSEFLERKSGLEHVAGVEPGGTFVLIYDSEGNNQVLADFSLPYLCCSKKEPVSLILPSAKLCQQDDPIVMTVIPANGEVKAFVNGVQISAITQSAGQSYFNPRLVTSTQLGQTITFTVNDDSVETQMIVHKNPEIVSVASGTVTYEAPTTNPDTTNPDAKVEFDVVGDLSGLTFTWDFNDGSQIVPNETPTNKKTHVYKLIAGQEDTFNPTLTVTNINGCSTVYKLRPLTLTGQSTIACLTGMRILIQYINGRKHPKQKGHTCDRATFNLKGNGLTIGGSENGNIFLSNTNGSNDKHNFPSGYNQQTYQGPDRASEITISQDEAQQIAAKSSDGFITFSLECALNTCHTGVAWTQIFLADSLVPIYDDYPTDNFLQINPCTGDTR